MQIVSKLFPFLTAIPPYKVKELTSHSKITGFVSAKCFPDVLMGSIYLKFY
jgi:hypothetical protein